MTKDIDDLKTDALFAASMVDYWAATRDYHEREKQKSHLEYIDALAESTRAHNALIAFQGASS
jgi:hypothetical protein